MRGFGILWSLSLVGMLVSSSAVAKARVQVSASSPALTLDAWSPLLVQPGQLVQRSKAWRALAAGHWTLVWLDGFAKMMVQSGGAKPACLRVESRGYALIEHELVSMPRGWVLANDLPYARAFLLGAGQQPINLHLTSTESAVPDLALDRAQQQIVQALARGQAPAKSWLTNKPELQAILQAGEQLSMHKEWAEIAKRWQQLAVTEYALRIRAPSLPGWHTTVLSPIHPGKVKSFEYKQARFWSVQGPATLEFSLPGQGKVEFEARALVPSERPAKLTLWHGDRRLDRVRLPSSPQMADCEHGRCAVMVFDAQALGRAARLRVGHARGASSKLRIQVEEGAVMLRLVHRRLRPWIFGPASPKPCAKLSAASLRDPLAQLLLPMCAKDPPSRQGLAQLLDKVCKPSTHRACELIAKQAARVDTLDKDARLRALGAVCQQTSLDSATRAALAAELTGLGAHTQATACLGASVAQDPDSAAARLFVARNLPALVAMRQALLRMPDPDKHRGPWQHAWQTQSRWRQVPRSTAPDTVVLAAPPGGSKPLPSKVTPSGSWRMLKSGQVYELKVAPRSSALPLSDPLSQGTPLERLELRWSAASGTSIKTVIDGQSFELDAASGTTQSWLLAPGTHRFSVHGPPDAKLLAKVAPQRPFEVAPFRLWRLWDLSDRDPQPQFQLPPNVAQLPLRLDLALLDPGRSNEGRWSDLVLEVPGHRSRKIRLFRPARSQAEQVRVQGPATGVLRSLWLNLPADASSLRIESAQGQPFAAALASRVSRTPEQTVEHRSKLLEPKHRLALTERLQAWIAAPQDRLQDHRQEIEQLLSAYRVRRAKRRGHYRWTGQQPPPSAIAAGQMLGPPVDPSLARSRLKATLDALSRESSPHHEVEAMNAAFGYLAAQPVDDKDAPWPAIYGLTHGRDYRIQSSRLSGLRAKAASRTKWQLLAFPTKSAGFARTVHPAKAPELGQRLGPAWELEPGAFRLSQGQYKTMRFELAASAKLRLQRHCKAPAPQSSPGKVTIDLERQHKAKLQLRANQTDDHHFSLRAGEHRLRLQDYSASPWRCVFRIQQKDASQTWQTIRAPSQRRWHVARSQAPLEFIVQGPGTLALRLRALGRQAASVGVEIQGERESKRHEHRLAQAQDTRLRLASDPTLAIGEALDLQFVLPSRIPYRVQVAAPHGELLVRAKERVRAPQARSSPSVAKLVRELQARLPPAATVATSSGSSAPSGSSGSSASSAPLASSGSSGSSPTSESSGSSASSASSGSSAPLASPASSGSSAPLASSGSSGSSGSSASSAASLDLIRLTSHRAVAPTPAPAWASVELGAGGGVMQESEFERIVGRSSLGLWVTGRKALWPGRGWLVATAQVQSQRLSPPALMARLQSSFVSRKLPLRVRAGGQLAAQHLAGRWMGAGRGFAELSGSLRNGFIRHTRWDLRPALRLDARWVDKDAPSIAKQSAYTVHSQIYRRYSARHPWSLRPRLDWRWRDFRNARLELGQDAWLNASFKSFDRTRGWLRVAGFAQGRRAQRWWIYQMSYRWTRAFADEHRADAFTRHELGGELAWQRQRKHTRLSLNLRNTAVFQSGRYFGNSTLFGMRVWLDTLQDLVHLPPQDRRFLREYARQDWWGEATRGAGR